MLFDDVAHASCRQGASDETDKVKPWTQIAKYKLQAEEELRKIAGLNLIIVRPAIVYGPGDVAGISAPFSPPASLFHSTDRRPQRRALLSAPSTSSSARR